MKTCIKFFSPFFIIVAGLGACRPAAAPSEMPTLSAQTAAPVQTPTSIVPQPVTSPGDATPDPLLDLPYTEADPLTDHAEIERILDELQQREVAWFSRPGWYRFTIDWPLGRDYTRTRYVLTHAVDENRDCLEQFVYFERDGIILPASICLADGTFGSITHSMDGTFQVNNMLPAEEAPPCDLASGMSIGPETADSDFILHDEASQFRKASSSEMEGIQTDFRVWIEKVDGKQTLVLVFDVSIEDPSLRGGVLDPTTDTFSPSARTLRVSYIDLETGLQVRFDEEHFLENGKRINNDGVGLLYSYEYMETMPDPVEESFNDVAAVLRAMREEAGKNTP